MAERTVYITSLPPPGHNISLFHGTSELCRYAVTIDYGAATVVVVGPGLQRLYSLESQPFAAILDSDNGSDRDIGIIAITLAEAHVHDEDLNSD